MKKYEIDLKNPIFALYLDTRNVSSQSAERKIDQAKKAFSIYNNITVWVIAADRTEIVCIFDGNKNKRDNELSELIEELNNRIDILSNSRTYEDFKIKVRDWRLKSILPKDGKQEKEN